MRSRFGIAEWFGHPIETLTPELRSQLARIALAKSVSGQPPCPFRSTPDRPVRCGKPGGVCSTRTYLHDDESLTLLPDIRSLCPYRFSESNLVNEWIGETILGCTSPIVIGEVPFLARPRKEEDREDSDEKKVGRIDRVLLSSDTSPLDWCAVEVQAVYMSGKSGDVEFRGYLDFALNDPSLPGVHRRPDYRSSGPKRLLPQLQIKVPTIRRWGKKMCVVVDEYFFQSLGAMRQESSVSNCDIAWFVVGFHEEASAIKLVRKQVYLTTLDDAVEGLIAGRPLTKLEFEAYLLDKARKGSP